MAAPQDPIVLYPVRGMAPAALYQKNEDGAGGFYPVGANGYWHGGVHFRFSGPEPLIAVADGELVAYRFDEEPLAFEVEGYAKDHKGESDYSRSFVLLKHVHVTPNGKEIVYFALYMHLCSRKEMASLPLPTMFQKRWRVVGTKAQAIHLLDDASDPKSSVGSVAVGAYLAKLSESPTHYKVRCRGPRRFQGYALLPKGFDKQRLRVKRDKDWDPVKLPIWDGDDRRRLVGYLRTPEDDDHARATLSATRPPKPVPPKAPPAKKGEAPPPPPPAPPPKYYEEGGEAFDAEAYEGWFKVDFRTEPKNAYTEDAFVVEGWIEKGRCLAISTTGFVLAGEGINVHERVPGEKKDGKEGPPTFVARGFLAKDSLVTFKDPSAVKEGEHCELSTGGWVLVDGASLVAYEGNVEPKYGSIQAPGSRVLKGEVIGYAGPYLFDRSCVHFEIITAKRQDAKGKVTNDSVCENAAKDQWGYPLTVVIDADATFKKRKAVQKGTAPAANPPIEVTWVPGSVLRVLDIESSPAARDWVERYYKVTRGAVMGWVESRFLQITKVANDAGAPDDRYVKAVGKAALTGRATAKDEIPGLFFEIPSLDPEDTAKPDIAVTIPKGKEVAVGDEGKRYVRCRFPDIEVEKTREAFVDPAAIKVENKRPQLAASVAGLYSTKTAGAAPDVNDGCPLAAGTAVEVLAEGSAKKKTLSRIRYRYKVKQDLEGWVDAACVTELPPPKDAKDPPRACELARDVDGLFATPPRGEGQKLKDPPDVKIALKTKTAGTILEDSKRFTRIVHKLDGEKTGWTRLQPSARGSRYFTHKAFGGDLLPEGAYFDAVGRRAVAVNIKSLYTDNPNASRSSFEEDAGKNTETLRISVTSWVRQVVQNRWIEVTFAEGKTGYIDILSDDGPNKGKVHRLSPYDWPGWCSFHEDEAKEFSKDGLCDVPELLVLVGKALEDPGHKVTPKEVVAVVKSHQLTTGKIREAIHLEGVAAQLRRAACLHPTEWDGDADGELAKYADLKERTGLDEAAHRQTLEHIKKIQFWGEVKKACTSLPAGNAVWHYHPIGFLENLNGFAGVTEAQLREIAPRAKASELRALVPELNALFFKYDINTRLRQAHFLAQCAHESADFGAKKEENTVDFFEESYGYRNDLCNFLPGDGARFPGRGLIQMTGRLAYMRYATHVDENFSDEGGGARGPSGVEEYPYRADGAGWTWAFTKDRDLNAVADTDDLEEVTRWVNGAYNHLDRRAMYLLRAYRTLRR